MENCAYTSPETAEHSMKCSVISRNCSCYRRGRVTKMIVRMMLALSLCPFTVRFAHATTYDSDGSPSDVQAKANLCSEGDTGTIPAGTFHWKTGAVLNVPANVTLSGAGTSATGGGDQSVIIDDYASNAVLISITVASSGVFRMTGLTVQGGLGVLKDNGVTSLTGPGQVRLDHIHINTQSYHTLIPLHALMIGRGITGVLDHSLVDLYSTSAIYPVNGVDSQGNSDWASATGFGSSNAFFIEDNIITGTAATHDTRIVDAYTGGHYVIRFNTVIASCLGEDHATGHSGDDRGCRSHELYGNLCTQGVSQTVP